MYADLDFWLALLAEEDAETAAIVEEFGDELAVSPVTVVQLFLLAEEYDLDLERAITAILSIADYPGEIDVLYRAAAYHDEGLDAFQAFTAAYGDTRVVSGDDAYDDVAVQRLWLE